MPHKHKRAAALPTPMEPRRVAIRSPSLAYVATHMEVSACPFVMDSHSLFNSKPVLLSPPTSKKEHVARQCYHQLIRDPLLQDDYVIVNTSSTVVEEEEEEDWAEKDEEKVEGESWRDASIMVVLFVILGASGWWSNNTINNENPVFINQTPEGNRFPTLASFACQIGNVFPIVYKSITGFCLSEATRRRIIAPTVYVGLLSGALILAVCAFFWKETIVLGGQEYSGVLLLCCVISGGIGCMSNVTYWAFASRYPVYCIKAMSTGMTFGGLLGSAIILGQKAGCTPTFSAEFYFLAGVAIQLVMLVGTLPILRFAKEDKDTDPTAGKAVEVEGESDDDERTPLIKNTAKVLSINNEEDTRNRADSDLVIKDNKKNQPAYINREGFILCCLCFTVYGMTYALAPMMPYVLQGYDVSTPHATNNTTGLPSAHFTVVNNHTVPLLLYTEPGGVAEPSLWYLSAGDRQTKGTSECNASSSSQRDGIYRWALVCQQVGDVSGRISTAFGTPTEIGTLLSLGLSAVLIFSLFCIGTAMSSSVPVWLPHDYGYVIPVLLLCYYFLRGFCVTSSYVWVKKNMPQRDAERLSSNLGMLGQMGALSGNVLMVILTYLVLQPPKQ